MIPTATRIGYNLMAHSLGFKTYSPFPLHRMIQQTKMHTIWRILLILICVLPCTGFNITIPPQVFSGNITQFPWEWNVTDYQRSLSAVFLATLCSLPDNFSCLRSLNHAGMGGDGVGGISLSIIIEDHAIVKNPTNSSEASGTLLLTANTSGPHVICTYGNLPRRETNSSGQQDISSILNSLDGLNLLDQSRTFEVLPGSAEANSATPTATTTNQNGWFGHSGGHHKRTQSRIAPIVGGVAGGPLTDARHPNKHVITPYSLMAAQAPKSRRNGKPSRAFRELSRCNPRQDHDTNVPEVPSPQRPSADLSNAVAPSSESDEENHDRRVIRYGNAPLEQRHVARHADSGWRPAAGSFGTDDVESLPPNYDEAK
ncbi:hypothetical protein L218DRAFT_951161 [Marasmius fiardii PR-910]|nr:hypothetical protein L218DRAFT_951161 [Marasmius fiardii PR-910]